MLDQSGDTNGNGQNACCGHSDKVSDSAFRQDGGTHCVIEKVIVDRKAKDGRKQDHLKPRDRSHPASGRVVNLAADCETEEPIDPRHRDLVGHFGYDWHVCIHFF